MSVERQRRALELLDQALERPGGGRLEFLEEACGEDEALYREVASMLETEVDAAVLAEPAFSVHTEDAGVGRRIDHYKLVRLLERGGMGTVYLAEREDFEQRVALKLIRRGLDLDEVFVRRFHTERQILARLDHPHIARLLDGGTTADRLPYFVMEYVEGEPIDRYCEARGLSVEQRLELFRKVCSAVQLAHQNLVIHRDLKPGNILITADGEPKLLDFGIAKLLDDSLGVAAVETELGQGPMTPRYASPEQIRLEPVTTASDVYSLGVLLYELLTGLDPYGVGSGRSDEIARAVCERDPEKPSTAVRRRAPAPEAAEPRKLRRRLAGDLDSIVLKAMRKEPGERYGSAEQLSEDLRRHLTGLPVDAQTGSFTYRAGKLVRRHWLGVVVTVAFVLLILGFGNALRQQEQERRQAERERQRAAAVSIFLEELIRSADPDQSRGENLTVLEVLGRGREQIIDDLENEPELQIYMAGTLGEVLLKLGFYDKSKEFMELSLRVARNHYGGDHPEVAKRLGNLAAVLIATQQFHEAESRIHEAFEMRLRLDQSVSELLRAKNNLATALMLRGDLEEAERLYLEVLRTRVELYEPEYGPDDKDIATSRRHLGAVYLARGKLEQAEIQLRQALETRRRVFGSESTKVAAVLDPLGSVLAERGREDEAVEIFDEALTIWSRLRDEDHLAVARAKVNLAAVLVRRDPATARVLVTQALPIFRQTQPDGWEVGEAESVLGNLLVGQGEYEEAEPLLVEGHALLVQVRGESYFRTRRAHARILELYSAWGDLEKLEQYRAMAEPAAQE